MNNTLVRNTVKRLNGFTEFVVTGKELRSVDAPQFMFDVLVDEAYDRWGGVTAENLVNAIYG